MNYVESRVHKALAYDFEHNVCISMSVGYPAKKYDRKTNELEQHTESMNRTLDDNGLTKDCVVWIAVTSTSKKETTSS